MKLIRCYIENFGKKLSDSNTKFVTQFKKGEGISVDLAYVDPLDENLPEEINEELPAVEELEEITEDMDEDDIAQLAFAAFEQGNDVSQYLDDMDEDDVEKLAFMASNAGKDIEAYLDYMDEDAIKRLLFQSIRK